MNPVMRVGEQIAEAVVAHEKVTWAEGWSRARRLVGMVGIDDSRVTDYPHEFSGGMKQRIIIAMALACNPSLIIADEPTTALDVLVQALVIKQLRDIQDRLDVSMILISHDLSVIATMCDKVAIMYAGKIVEYSSAKNVFHKASHPYTKMLLEAFPSMKTTKKPISIPGYPPNLLTPPSGCRFHPRCPYAFDRCVHEEPKLRKVTEGHGAACFLSGED